MLQKRSQTRHILALTARLYPNPSLSMMDIGSDQTRPTSPSDAALIATLVENILYSELREGLPQPPLCHGFCYSCFTIEGRLLSVY